MAIGKSGRLVIEIDPDIKQELHLRVKKKGLNLKEWFEAKIRDDFPEIFQEIDQEDRS